MWEIFKKLKINLPYDPGIPLLGICPKDSTSYFTSTDLAMFIAVLVTIARKWKQPKCPTTDGWIMKNDVHIHHKALFIGK